MCLLKESDSPSKSRGGVCVLPGHGPCPSERAPARLLELTGHYRVHVRDGVVAYRVRPETYR